MQNRASLVIKPINRLMRNTVIPHLRFRLNGNPVTPLFKQTGYYVFLNTEPGAYAIEITSEQFEPAHLDTVIEADKSPMVFPVLLNPIPSSNMSGSIISAHGQMVAKRGAPLRTDYCVYITGNTSLSLKVAQDIVEPGTDRLKLYHTNLSYTLPIPGPFSLCASKGTHREQITIQKMDDGYYILDQPVKNRWRRGDMVFELIQGTTDDMGMFHISFKRFDNLADACLQMQLEVGGTLVEKSFPLANKSTINLGTIKL